MASSDEKNMRGKTAFITGGGRGIGQAVARAYAQAGARVFICGREPAAVEKTAGEIRSAGGEIDGRTGDIGNAADAARLVRAALERFGAIDVLVNNASILGPRVPVAEYPLEAWEDVVRINLNGLFFVTRAALPAMLARRSGSIINVSSGVGRTGKARWGAYAVSKAGVENFTQVLADEVKDAGIRVNAVNPAATGTEMRASAYPDEDPMTLPTPAEITPVFLYLATDGSAHITGKSLEARDWLRRSD
jgi:NAD(P)-dependent dehydrogenase (short-subunit alcohol dehydrogenase family)